MSEYVITPANVPYLEVRGSTGKFPVHRIYCVGRNYADHAIEMGHDPDKEAPFFFQKNPDNLVIGNHEFPYPPMSSDVHHEIELVVALHSGGCNISAGKALTHVYGYAVGLDMTRRDLQGEAKKMGRPWEIGKAFEHSAPCSEVVPVSETGHPDQGSVTLKINGTLRQQGDLNQLIWKVPEIIATLSGLFALKAGDLIMTGTPAGVGPVNRGDRLDGHIEGVGSLQVNII
jgi:fumarylpyruvate hydrolase